MAADAYDLVCGAVLNETSLTLKSNGSLLGNGSETVASETRASGPPARPGSALTRLSDSLSDLAQLALAGKSPEQQKLIIADFIEDLRSQGHQIPPVTSTPYINTIPADKQPAYPGDLNVERRIKSYIRWNAMAMVVKANHTTNVGGHISTFASSATLYEVGQNHFFRGGDGGRTSDFVYFQGHASPGPYARSFLEGRLTEAQLHNFRQELAPGGGLSSYPHPYLMPDYWQFPTVSMGLGPIMSIYQARFNRYLVARKLVPAQDPEPHIWCYVGDGECDEPETLGQLTLGARESLDNLTWVINCNLQRLDGPVRGNSKIIQELESLFRGAGWNVIKVVWGSDWDELLARDESGLLARRMEEVVDGEYQKYIVEPGSYIRKNFFGKYPELLPLVNHLSDDQLKKLMRGGHDPLKVYAAYDAALKHKGRPTVILAKTVKGYGLGEAGEGRNPSHQQKKMNERELREFRRRFNVPISDEVIADAPFFRPAEDSPEMTYLHARRQALGGYLPKRTVRVKPIQAPSHKQFSSMLAGSSKPASTTMAYVLLLNALLRNKEVGKYIVPIVPDEARTFGMDGLFRTIGIYSPKGQLYSPVDHADLNYYLEKTDGQLLEEGINEAGSMASFIAAGTAYASHGVPMIPMYIYYSMFGFQRIGDMCWLAGDIRARGFMFGATSGRTTLNGEGLQHEDGHSHLFASTIPSCVAYEPTFGYELTVIVCDGIKRMYQDQEDIFYYISVQNENYVQPSLPSEDVVPGILSGLYKYKPGSQEPKIKAQLFGSGSIMLQALRAQEILAEKYGVSADVWSATSYNRLRREALAAKRWNMLHPMETPRRSYLETVLASEKGPFIAVSDNIKMLPDQIAPWVPGGLMTLGTDGFGRSDIRPRLRRFFEIDAESVVIATLYTLSQRGEIPATLVAQAIRDLGVDPEKIWGESS